MTVSDALRISHTNIYMERIGAAAPETLEPVSRLFIRSALALGARLHTMAPVVRPWSTASVSTRQLEAASVEARTRLR